MHPALSIARTALYGVGTLFALLTMGLSAGAVAYTEQKTSSYYAPSAELIAAGFLGMICLPVLHFVFHMTLPMPILSSVLVEIPVLAVLWLLFIGGAGATVSQLPGLSGCTFTICQILQAMEAFAWLEWVVLTALIILVITTCFVHFFSGRKNVFLEELSGRHTRRDGIPMGQVH